MVTNIRTAKRILECIGTFFYYLFAHFETRKLRSLAMFFVFLIFDTIPFFSRFPLSKIQSHIFNSDNQGREFVCVDCRQVRMTEVEVI